MNQINSVRDDRLLFAACHGKYDDVVQAIKNGGNPNCTCRFGLSVLGNAIRYGSEGAVITLIENGANVNTTNQFGRTLLSIHYKHSVSMFRILVANGANYTTTQVGWLYSWML